MEDDERSALSAYFERDIGSPPLGARERVLAGLEAASRRPQRSRLTWAAAAAAVLVSALVVVTLLGVRGVHRAQPASQDAVPTQPASQNAVPGPRVGAAIAYDAGRGVLVMFGPAPNRTPRLGETWTWDGAHWTQLHPAVSPPLDKFDPTSTGTSRSYPALLMAYDAASGSLVLYGIPGSTWTWDGRSWQRHPTAPPTTRITAAAGMAYDPGARSMLLYLADSTQTWRWDGARWTQLHPRTTPNVAQGSMGFDGSHLLLFGPTALMVQGQHVTETWAWDGADWSLLRSTVRLPIDTTYATAYDEARGRLVVLLAGSGSEPWVSETWVWDGATWSRDQPQHEPPVRVGAVAWYDSRARLVALYGGIDARGQTVLGDMWAWDGNDWRLVEGVRG